MRRSIESTCMNTWKFWDGWGFGVFGRKHIIIIVVGTGESWATLLFFEYTIVDAKGRLFGGGGNRCVFPPGFEASAGNELYI
jgi:hypothetical protein